MKLTTTLLVVLFLLQSLQITAQVKDENPTSNPDQKVALVIGNSSYLNGPLLNPANDARAMAEALRKTGFDVLGYTDVKTFSDMKRVIREFGRKIENGGVGLFYYAGHGMQVNGKNYLIPTEAEIYAEEEVEYEAIDVGFVMVQMEIARNRMNIIILDACRNNPFTRSWRSGATGLAFLDAPAGTLIAYATAPGSVASDGNGENGLYTEELLAQISKEGMKIEDVFKKVRIGVMERSNNMQTPWETSSLTGDFYFVDPRRGGPDMTGDISTADSEENSVDDIVPEEDIFRTTGGAAEGTWKASGENYSFYINDVDESFNIESELIDGNLIVYHPETEQSFLLRPFSEMTDNKLRPAINIVSSSDAFWIAGEKGFWLLVKGNNVALASIDVWIDDDLLVFVPETSEYYLLRDYENREDLTLRAAEKIFTKNGTLWRASDGYWLYLNGESIASRTYSSWSGNDLVVYDEQGKGSYLLKDYYNREDNRLRTTIMLAGPGVMTWKREESTYYVYRDNVLISNDANYCLSGNDLLIYENPTQQTILCEDWANRGDGQIREAEVLFSPTASFWRKFDDSFYFYKEGELVELELETKERNGNLEVYDKEYDQTYIFQGYNAVKDNKLRAAILKTGVDFR